MASPATPLNPPPSSVWWFTPRRTSAARCRLLVFPHAGGGPCAYMRFAETFRETPITVSLVRYPARETRLLERGIEHWRTLVSSLAEALLPLTDLPMAFFGHSFGATIAFELARLWRSGRVRPPVRLFLSGRCAPQQPTDTPDVRGLSDWDLVQTVARRYDAIPGEALAHPEIVEVIAPALRADFSCLQSYAFEPGEPLDIPFTLLRGTDDRWIAAADLARWAVHTTANVEEEVFPGGHFYLDQSLLRVHEIVRRGFGAGASVPIGSRNGA